MFLSQLQYCFPTPYWCSCKPGLGSRSNLMDAKTQFVCFCMTCTLTYFVLSSLCCFSKMRSGVDVWAFIKMLLS